MEPASPTIRRARRVDDTLLQEVLLLIRGSRERGSVPARRSSVSLLDSQRAAWKRRR